MQRPSTRARPAQPSDDDVPYQSQLHRETIPLYEWQQKWRPVLFEHVERNDRGGINGLYVISDAFAERPFDTTTNAVGEPRSTHHVTCGYSTRLTERLSMEYPRLWPQRGRVRVHWILPLPGSMTVDEARRIEERIHMYCAVHARSERLRITEFYMPEALPLLWECFKSVQEHLGNELPYRLDASLQSGEHCWVYSKPRETHPPVDIFKRGFTEERKRWLEYRRNEMDLMKDYRVQGVQRIERGVGRVTRSRSLVTRALPGGGEVDLYEPFVSPRKEKKYAVYVRDGRGGKRLIHFGSREHQHFRDKIGAFSHLDHGDPERRKRYYQRHGQARSKDTAKWWSHHILW